jgi:hypothetical protein
MNSSTARHLSIASIGFAVDSGSAGSSIITVGRRDETRWSIPCLGSLVGHYGSEQRYRRLDFGGSGVRRDSDGNRHESAIQRDVEQFLTHHGANVPDCRRSWKLATCFRGRGTAGRKSQRGQTHPTGTRPTCRQERIARSVLRPHESDCAPRSGGSRAARGAGLWPSDRPLATSQ